MIGACNTAATMVADICGDPSMADEVRRSVAAAGEPRPVNAREALEICREEISDLLKHWGPFDDHVESKLKELVIKCDAGLSSPSDNSMKLREAVEKLLGVLYNMGVDENTLAIAIASPNCHMNSEHILSVLKDARAALAAPARNCDVGTAEEQTHRFDRHCDKYLLNRDEDEECVGCPLVNMAGHCELNWAQMPYEREVGK